MIKATQSRDPILVELEENVRSGKFTDFTLDDEGILWISGRLCGPDVDNQREEILEETHFVAYSVHPGATKMYHSIRDLYWWDGLKKDVADYVAKCLTCQQVKAEHQKPSGKLQPLPIPEWKWERITMDFVVGCKGLLHGRHGIADLDETHSVGPDDDVPRRGGIGGVCGAVGILDSVGTAELTVEVFPLAGYHGISGGITGIGFGEALPEQLPAVVLHERGEEDDRGDRQDHDYRCGELGRTRTLRPGDGLGKIVAGGGR